MSIAFLRSVHNEANKDERNNFSISVFVFLSFSYFCFYLLCVNYTLSLKFAVVSTREQAERRQFLKKSLLLCFLSLTFLYMNFLSSNNCTKACTFVICAEQMREW